MSNEQFCYHLCLAAKKLGIFLRLDVDSVTWYDPTSNMRWAIRTMQGKKDQLFTACNSLQNYLNRP